MKELRETENEERGYIIWIGIIIIGCEALVTKARW